MEWQAQQYWDFFVLKCWANDYALFSKKKSINLNIYSCIDSFERVFDDNSSNEKQNGFNIE